MVDLVAEMAVELAVSHAGRYRSACLLNLVSQGAVLIELTGDVVNRLSCAKRSRFLQILEAG